MRGKAKAYGCGYIFRFDLKLKILRYSVAIARVASGIFSLSFFGYF